MWNGNSWDPTSTSNNLGPITWTIQNGPTPFTGRTSDRIVIYVQNTVVSTPRNSEIAELHRAKLARRLRLLLWQELQSAPRHPLPAPSDKPRLALTPHQRFSLLGQAHRMGRS